MPQICPKCGDANQDLSVFCKSCGYSLAKTNHDYKVVVEAPARKSKGCFTQPKKYKICPQCNTANKLNQSRCSECLSDLPEWCVKEIDLEAEYQKKAEKEARKRSAIGIAGAIWVLFMTILSIILGGGLGVILLGDFVIIMCVLNLLYPEEMFRFSHMFSIREVELTDTYFIFNRIGSVLALVLISVSMLLYLFLG